MQQKKGDDYFVDLENIKNRKESWWIIDDTQVVKGIVLDKEVVHSGMPTKINNAKIALINSALEIEKLN